MAYKKDPWLTSRKFYSILIFKFFYGNLLIPPEWNVGILECWNVGDKGGNKPFKL